MAYARTQSGAMKRVKIKRELRRLGSMNFKNDDPLKELKKELKQLKSKKQYNPNYNAYGSFKSGCPRSYSNEHSYEPYKKGKIKCVHCGSVRSMLYPK